MLLRPPRISLLFPGLLLALACGEDEAKLQRANIVLVLVDELRSELLFLAGDR